MKFTELNDILDKTVWSLQRIIFSTQGLLNMVWNEYINFNNYNYEDALFSDVICMQHIQN